MFGVRWAALGAMLSVVAVGVPVGPDGPLLEALELDKAQYRPGQSVDLDVTLRNTSVATWRGDVSVRPERLGLLSGSEPSRSVVLAPGQSLDVTFTLGNAWETDTGYGVAVTCTHTDGSITDRGWTAFDVSADWTRFPRYAYLTRFADTASAAQLIDPLKDFKVNALQFYDWSDEHHILYRDGHDYWQDIAGRDPWVSRPKLVELITRARSYNMASMAYILANGAYEGYEDDGVRPEWGLYTRPRDSQAYTRTDQDRHELNIPGWETPRIYLMNPGDPGWQAWMRGQVASALAVLPFDGVHVDSLGDRGERYDWTGGKVDLAASYASFVRAMRTQLGRRPLIFNAVSQYAMDDVAGVGGRGVTYAEMWTERDDDFYDLKSSLGRWASLAPGRGRVVAGYVNYEHSKRAPGGFFNEASVLMAQAAILANGGWQIALGDGNAMLSNEYFPNTNLSLKASTLEALRTWADFGVAHQNLLRDGVVEGFKRIDFDVGGQIPSNYNAAIGGVWKLSMRRPPRGCEPAYDIAHFINLRSACTTRWRDVEACAQEPQVISWRPVRMYFDGVWGASRVWHASPDSNGGRPVAVPNPVTAYDPAQRSWYVEFTLPSLKYWTMVWIERNPDLNADGVLDAADLTAMGETPVDINADGVVDDRDTACLRSRIDVPRTLRTR